MLLHFEAEQWLPHPVERVFAFFADPGNLPRLMPGWQRARIESAALIAPPAPPEPVCSGVESTAGSGTRLTLTFRPLPYSPVRLRWEALIEDFRWNQGFCDVQLRGPFRHWRHCHSVEPVVSALDGSPGTLLRDTVACELPLGPLGVLAGKIFFHRLLTAAFTYRHRQTAKLLALSIQGRPRRGRG